MGNREKWGCSDCRGWTVLSLSVAPACGPLVPKEGIVEVTGLRDVYWVGQKVLSGLSVGCNGKPPTNFLANQTRPLLLSEFIPCKHADESHSQDSFSLACAKLPLMPLAYPESKSKNICMFFLLYIFELIEKIIYREYYFCSLKKKKTERKICKKQYLWKMGLEWT